jgi:hypothetical protein
MLAKLKEFFSITISIKDVLTVVEDKEFLLKLKEFNIYLNNIGIKDFEEKESDLTKEVINWIGVYRQESSFPRSLFELSDFNEDVFGYGIFNDKKNEILDQIHSLSVSLDILFNGFKEKTGIQLLLECTEELSTYHISLDIGQVLELTSNSKKLLDKGIQFNFAD